MKVLVESRNRYDRPERDRNTYLSCDDLSLPAVAIQETVKVFNPNEAVEEVFESVLKSAVGEIAKDQVKNIVSAAAAQVAGAAAESLVVGFVSPLLKMLLKVGDETSKNVKNLVKAPLLTGLREAREALYLQAFTPGDQAVKEERLANADFELARAKSLLETGSKAERAKTFICLTRALICFERQAPQAASLALSEALQPLVLLVNESDEILKQWQYSSTRTSPPNSRITMAHFRLLYRRMEDHVEDVQLGRFIRALITSCDDPIQEARRISKDKEGKLLFNMMPWPTLPSV